MSATATGASSAVTPATTTDGTATVMVAPGTYRIRFDGDGFVSFEREVFPVVTSRFSIRPSAAEAAVTALLRIKPNCRSMLM